MTTEQEEGLAGAHRYKLKPPTYNREHAQYEEWKYKFQAYMGLQHGEHERFMRELERGTTRIMLADLEGAAASHEEATAWKQLTITRDEVHPDNNMQTAPTRDRLRDPQTTEQPIFNPSRNQERGMLDTARGTNIGSKQLRGKLLPLGIRADKA